MSFFETADGLDAVEQVGSSLEELGKGLRRLAHVGRRQLRTKETSASRAVIPEMDEVWRLWARLGPANQGFLYRAAEEFRPGEAFSLDDLADTLGMTKGTARARMMNIGRSLKSLGPRGPHLWHVDWDHEARENSYEWDFDAHRAVLRIVEG
jgi:hypothetical protein